ncbi:MAG: protocatechuate 3,4-dioxygenase subunit alpha [Chloroflexota bacterium]
MVKQSLGQTPSQTVGPFFSFGLFNQGKEHILTNDQTKGKHISLTGQILDGDGEPVNDALIEIWQPDTRGYFNHPIDPNHPNADPNFSGFGRSETSNNGTYRFETIKPGAIAHSSNAPYVNVRIFARGMLIHVVTRIYFDDEPANDMDPVLLTINPARRKTLIAMRVETSDLLVYRLDVRLQGDNETVFFDA